MAISVRSIVLRPSGAFGRSGRQVGASRSHTPPTLSASAVRRWGCVCPVLPRWSARSSSRSCMFKLLQYCAALEVRRYEPIWAAHQADQAREDSSRLWVPFLVLPKRVWQFVPAFRAVCLHRELGCPFCILRPVVRLVDWAGFPVFFVCAPVTRIPCQMHTSSACAKPDGARFSR